MWAKAQELFDNMCLESEGPTIKEQSLILMGMLTHLNEYLEFDIRMPEKVSALNTCNITTLYMEIWRRIGEKKIFANV